MTGYSTFRFLSSPIIFPSVGPPVQNGVLVLDNERVVEILDHRKAVPEEKLEVLDGFLCPGFVNAHCHLELSHLKGHIGRHTSLPGFISEILRKRSGFSEADILHAAIKADEEMWNAGIVAVGDICNTLHTLPVKKKSGIYYHSFVEVFDLNEVNALSVYAAGKVMMDAYRSAGLKATMVPHAPYSVSPSLMRLIWEESSENDSICIHNQENGSENAMFRNNSGALFELFRSINADYASWTGRHPSSLAYTLSFADQILRYQLVHNTYTSLKDIQLAGQSLALVYWCLCARANGYIENVFPPVKLLDDCNCMVTIGTDSYASNDSLSVLDELNAIAARTEHISVEKLLHWATLNGASFLNIEDRFGSFEKGKKPGVNLITDVNLLERKLTPLSKIQKIC